MNTVKIKREILKLFVCLVLLGGVYFIVYYTTKNQNNNETLNDLGDSSPEEFNNAQGVEINVNDAVLSNGQLYGDYIKEHPEMNSDFSSQ